MEEHLGVELVKYLLPDIEVVGQALPPPLVFPNRSVGLNLVLGGDLVPQVGVKGSNDQLLQFWLLPNHVAGLIKLIVVMDDLSQLPLELAVVQLLNGFNVAVGQSYLLDFLVVGHGDIVSILVPGGEALLHEGEGLEDGEVLLDLVGEADLVLDELVDHQSLAEASFFEHSIVDIQIQTNLK